MVCKSINDYLEIRERRKRIVFKNFIISNFLKFRFRGVTKFMFKKLEFLKFVVKRRQKKLKNNRNGRFLED